MNKLITLSLALISLIVASSSFGAVTVSGSYATNMKKSDGTTAATGNRYIVVADTGNDGFGTGGYASGSLAVGQSFGGDIIIDSGTVASTFGGRAPANIASQPFDLAPYNGKQFALVWFDTLTGTSATDGLVFGRVTGATWLLPAAAGSHTLGFTTGALSGGSPYATDVTTKSAAGFSVGAAPIPEPSRMMLLGFGLLGIFFRRRR